jgi:hypothetical protein
MKSISLRKRVYKLLDSFRSDKILSFLKLQANDYASKKFSKIQKKHQRRKC